MLPDAAHLQEEEAAFANRHRTSKHDPALPLYTVADADRVLAQAARGLRATLHPAPGVEARFTPSGHILGAGLVTCAIGGRRLVFSGDLGRYDVPIMVDPDPVAEADVLLVESTYGNRVHPPDDPVDRLDGRGAPGRRSEGLAPHPRLRGGPLAGDPATICAPSKNGAIPTSRSSSTARWGSRPPRSTRATPRSTTRR